MLPPPEQRTCAQQRNKERGYLTLCAAIAAVHATCRGVLGLSRHGCMGPISLDAGKRLARPPRCAGAPWCCALLPRVAMAVSAICQLLAWPARHLPLALLTSALPNEPARPRPALTSRAACLAPWWNGRWSLAQDLSPKCVHSVGLHTPCQLLHSPLTTAACAHAAGAFCVPCACAGRGRYVSVHAWVCSGPPWVAVCPRGDRSMFAGASPMQSCLSGCSGHACSKVFHGDRCPRLAVFSGRVGVPQASLIPMHPNVCVPPVF